MPITPVGKWDLCLTGLLLLAGSAHALDPDKRLNQYMHTSWRMQDGSAPAGMRSITQTSDGFLWLASVTGDAYRFDGVRFLRRQISSSGGSIRKVFGDHAGGFWVLAEREIVHWKGGRIASHFDLGGLASLQAASEDSDGSLWVVRSSNSIAGGPLCHVTDRGVQCLAKPDGVPITPIDSLLADGKGGFWLGGQTALVHWHGGASEVYPIKELRSNAGQGGIANMAFGPAGSLWLGVLAEGPGLGFGRWMAGAFKPFLTPSFDGSKVVVTALVSDRDGSLWIGTSGKGIFRVHENRVDHYDHTDGLSGDSVEALFEDREGIVWAGTSNGMDSFHDPRITTFSALQGLGKDVAVGLLASRDGSIWVANAESLDHIVNGVVTSIRTGSGLPGHQVTSLFEDHAGNLWVGVDDALYLFRNGRFRRLPEPNHQPLGMVMGLTEDIDRNIWAECVSKPRQLVRIQDFQVRQQFPAPQFPGGRSLAADPHGGIWIGTVAGDIALFRNGSLETKFPLNPGGSPYNREILALDDGSILASSENGLVQWRNGKVQRMTAKNGLPCDHIISFIHEPGKGWWLFTSCGVVELPESEFLQWQANPDAVVRIRLDDELDGAQPGQPSFNPAAYTADGRVWFANGFVVQTIDPAKLSKKALPAMTYIESVTVDRKQFPTAGNLKFAPNPRDVQIDYTSPTLLMPQRVKFRYRLDGYDHEWNNVGTRRQAFYMDLPPGNYSFRVIACNSDGVWNDSAAKLDFFIAPAYYQTNWFRALCVALLLALLWVAYRLRVRHLHEQFAITLEARIAERTRIARELHDTLLQSAHGVLLRFETVSQLFHDRPAEAKQQLDSAIQQTANFITEARDEVQGLRDSTGGSGDLAAEITSLGEALASGSATRPSTAFHVAMEGEAKKLHPIARDEIYKICAEALRNAFQHSGAQRIEVEIRYDRHQFRLRIRDNGKGIDPNVLDSQGAEGHFGIRGMRERATLIGGSLTVWSKVGAGAEVELRVPNAYATSQRRSRFPRKPWA